MSDSDRRLTRRTALKGLSAATGTALVGGAGAFALTGGAGASAALKVSIEDTSYSGDQGIVNWAGVDAQKVLKWHNFDVPVRYFGIKHEITLENDTVDSDTPWHTLYDKKTDRLTNWSSKGNGSDGWGGPGEYIAWHNGDKADWLNGKAVMDVSWAVISDGSHPSGYDSVQTPVDWTDLLTVETDGETKTRTVRWRTTITFYTEDADGNPEPITGDDGIEQRSGTTTFDLTVTNQGSTLDGGTDGSANMG